MRNATLFAMLFMLAIVLGAGPVRAETENCAPITTLPAVITVQGIYCLTGNLSTAMTSGFAIDIQTNNVVLDLNGFKLGGLAAGPSTLAHGIHADTRQNITIKNGTVRGFVFGISLLDTASQGHVVEDVRLEHNTLGGMRVEGSGTIIRNNQVLATGGATCCGPVFGVSGIHVVGAGPRVLDNDVDETTGVGTATSAGIVLSSTGGLAVNNRITRADQGVQFAGTGGSTGKYRDNLTFDVTTPYVGSGTDAGNNN